MNEHVHEWMVSSVKGVYLAICNTLDVNGQATCDAELTSSEIDTRLNATERLSAEQPQYKPYEGDVLTDGEGHQYRFSQGEWWGK